MRTLTVKVQSADSFWEESHQSAKRIDAGDTSYQGEVYSFETLPLLLSVFSPKRWDLIIELQKIGPSTLRGLARELGRDVKRVHEDADVLLREGILERNQDKKLFVPYAEIRIEATLSAPETTAA